MAQDPKYAITIPSEAGTDASRRTALGQTVEGAIRVSAGHWLQVVLKPGYFTQVGQMYETTMHKVEYVFWPAIVALGEDIDNVTWYIKPSRLTALVKDLCETAGLGFETTLHGHEPRRGAGSSGKGSARADAAAAHADGSTGPPVRQPQH